MSAAGTRRRMQDRVILTLQCHIPSAVGEHCGAAPFNPTREPNAADLPHRIDRPAALHPDGLHPTTSVKPPSPRRVPNLHPLDASRDAAAQTLRHLSLQHGGLLGGIRCGGTGWITGDLGWCRLSGKYPALDRISGPLRRQLPEAFTRQLPLRDRPRTLEIGFRVFKNVNDA